MTLPGWLSPLPDAAQQRELDSWAIDQAGIPSGLLMERAGAGLARVVAQRAPSGRVALLCGKGNNGGDGLVAARLLRAGGRDADVLALTAPEDWRGDAGENLQRLPGPGPQPFAVEALEGAALVVDAMLGTGSSGAPRGPVAAAIAAVKGTGVPVVACDVPSGVDASTGEVAGAAVRARATVTFHAGKPGLWIAPGKTHAGAVQVIDIGIPAQAPLPAQVGLIGWEVLRAIPRRGASSTKFEAGRVLVCGGSRGLTGAPCLAAEAAMRAGAGYVTVAAPASLGAVLQQRLLEVMTVALADEDGGLVPAAADAVLEQAGRGGAVVLGPGLGRREPTAELARRLAAGTPAPLVLDADGLNAHAGALCSLADRSAPTILTPHGGELARLLEVSGDEVRARRLALAHRAAEAARAVVVLKGDDTLVVEPGGRVAISPGGAPALATAGTGDVLSGVLGALLAKGMEPFDAACAGVYLHLEAGRGAGAPHGPDGVIARDVIAALPAALGAR